MDKFLGLPIRRKPITDAEHVERIRKNVSRAKLFGKWIVVFQAAVLVAWVCIFIAFGHMLQQMGNWAGGQGGNLALGGLFLGMLLGIGFGLPFLHAIEQFCNTLRMLKGDRTSELLIKYHDVLVELAKSDAAPASDEAGQGGEEVASAVPTPHCNELGNKHNTSVAN
jgi:hypothetical protein